MRTPVRSPRIIALALALTLPLLPPTSALAAPPCGVFVSKLQGSNVAGCGLDPSSPCATITYGMQRATAEFQSCVFVQAGTYAEILRVPDGLTIRGGYDSNWDYAARTVAGHLVVVVGGFDASLGNEALAVRPLSGASVTLANLEIDGSNASGTVNGAGRSAYAVYANNATLVLDDVRIVAGDGANGLAAAINGTSASQTAAPSGGGGGDAAEYITACDASSHGLGGAAGLNPNADPDARGGAGGVGGTMDTDCSFPYDFTNRAGVRGSPAYYWISSGYGYWGAGGPPCIAGGDAWSGTVTDGVGGQGGSSGSVVANLWSPNGGSAGSIGQHGTGGGGGGGSGGCDAGTDSFGAGGGGGGAGGARAPSAGSGGRGGGGTFCVFAVNSALTLTNCELVRGGGGAGGQGGTGGLGQPGGNQGMGGSPAGDSPRGGHGGYGARGGHSGAGGGGAGGVSVGVFRCGGSFSGAGIAYSGGLPGAGGPRGSTGILGTNGTNGVLGNVVLCSEPQPVTESVESQPIAAAAFTLASAGAVCDPVPCITLDVPQPGERFELAFAGAWPNPARGGAAFAFALPEPAVARIEIFDAGGRSVRVLDTGPLGAGRHVASWDGRDAAGGIAAAGIYFARFDALGNRFSRRFTLVR